MVAVAGAGARAGAGDVANDYFYLTISFYLGFINFGFKGRGHVVESGLLRSS